MNIQTILNINPKAARAEIRRAKEEHRIVRIRVERYRQDLERIREDIESASQLARRLNDKAEYLQIIVDMRGIPADVLEQFRTFDRRSKDVQLVTALKKHKLIKFTGDISVYTVYNDTKLGERIRALLARPNLDSVLAGLVPEKEGGQ